MKSHFSVRTILCCIAYWIFTQPLIAQEFSYSWFGTSSDYSLKIDYTITGGCDCDNSYSVSTYKNSYLPSDFLASSTRSSRRLTLVVGPSSNNNILISAINRGNNKFLGFCVSDCEFSGTFNFRGTTARIKAPYSGSATQDDEYITLSWKKGSDIPDGSLRYKIARDEPDNVIATISGGARSYTDENVAPGAEYTYYIYTYTSEWNEHQSRAHTVVGRTAALPLRTTFDQPRRVILSWDDLSAYTDEVTIRRNGEFLLELNINSPSDTSFTDDSPGLIPGYWYDYSVTWNIGDKEVGLSAKGATLPDGRIRGKISTPRSGLPIENVEVCAVLEQDIKLSSSDTVRAGRSYCDSTNANGQYDIRRIYYHNEATFTVTPSKENHAFDPAFYENQLLDLEFPSINGLNFLDTTSFMVSGYVYQNFNGRNCGLEGAEIWVNDAFRGVKTDGTGYYEFLVEEAGDYKIEPRLGEHTFETASRSLLIEQETTGIDFSNTTTSTLSGRVKGSCDISIGRAQIRVYSTEQGSCIDTVINTDSRGGYSAELPARPYQVEVIGFTPAASLTLDPDLVLAYFETREIDLSQENQRQDFIFRRPPEILVSGLPANACESLGTAIVEQGESYLIEIEVIERFGEEFCPVDSGYVLIFDEAGDQSNVVDTVFLDDGLGYYDLIPGQPNLIAPHQKLLQMEAVVGQEVAQWTGQLVVTGFRPREQTFTTVLPEIPFQILHDPPGDASYSYYETANRSSFGMRIFGQTEGSVTVKKEVKLGASTSFLGVEFESWGKIGGAVSAGARLSADTEWLVSLETTEAFSTSNNPNITGAEGDIFIGAAMNLIYAQVDLLLYNSSTCSLEKDIDLIMGNDGFATTFMYTEDHITNTLIPQLQGLSDFYEESNPDSAAIYNTQISVWKQVLENNIQNKRSATFVENRSFSAGATYASSVTGSASKSFSIELAAFMETSILAEAGFEINGSGTTTSTEAVLKIELGQSKFGTVLEENTTGFELRDDDPGDFFSINIKKDPVYGTPVFDLVSGRSSCPWEVGTQPRESLQLQADSYRQSDVPADEAAVFQLALGNISQSDEPRTYLLQFLQASNPDGAMVTIGGSTAQGSIPFAIPAGEQSQATITISKGPRAFDYEGLQFVLSSGCEDERIADTVSLSVSFRSEYPPLELATPQNSWLINGQSNDELLLRFLNYDLKSLRKVQLQISPKNQFAWSIAAEWQAGSLSTDPDGTIVTWLANELDGDYDIRLRADYGDADVYSSIVSGKIDRKAPEIFGLPEPADGELNAGEVIAISFDEPIHCFALNPQNVVFISLTDQTTYPAEIGCSGNTIIIKPLWNTPAHKNELVEVRLSGIADLFDNQLDRPIVWQFIIGNDAGNAIDDSDQDGIRDAIDNCPLASNLEQRDLDQDGIGDVCDSDMDNDGKNNDADNCPAFYNPQQTDTDGNGIGDICEPLGDGDGDGIINSADNCPFAANPGQEDQDQDGTGDVCDTDLDGDGVNNFEDNCSFIPNPDQIDSDANQIGDACETVTSTTAESLADMAIKISPNPASETVNLQFKITNASEVHIAVLSMDGRVVKHQKLQLPTQLLHSYSMNIADLKAGVYMIRIAGQQQIKSERLIITQ